MPRTKNPDKYPASYGKLLLTAYAREDDGIRVKCDSAAHANRLRRQLYAYIAAVESREKELKLDPDMRDAPRMHQVMITVEHRPFEGPSIFLRNKAFNPENIAITAALDALDEAAANTPEDDEAQSLAERIIAAHERGDLDEVARLEESLETESASPDAGTGEASTDAGDTSPFARFLQPPTQEN